MQVVTSAFTAEERSSYRNLAESLLISWHKESLLGNKTFTIGVSTIGGNDLIGINPGAIGSPGNYRYFDETSYLISLGWERGFNLPKGGLVSALAEAILSNTSERFTPRSMGGLSEISTAILPARPAIINAGFHLRKTTNGDTPPGVDITDLPSEMIPQFSGIITDPPAIDTLSKQISLKMQDYVWYFQNKKLDNAVIFTGQRTDQVITTLFQQLGMSTSQYDLDTGINIIPFGAFEAGIKFSDALGALVEAENGHLYQDETGTWKFENRDHWASAPYTQVQRNIHTSMVINAQGPDFSHIVNVVEISAQQYQKQPEQIIYRLNPFDNVVLNPNTTTDIFVNFDDPVLSMTTPSNGGSQSFYQANAVSDGSGTDLTSNITITKVSRFAQAAKITFSNNSSTLAYLTTLVITGRVARNVGSIFTRASIGSSITAYQEQVLQIDSNPFIQNQEWAETLANMLVTDFSNPYDLQRITIRAIPELQLGDLISWQGNYWRIYDIKATLDSSNGFIQDLLLLKRTITSYFRIGVSSIGGTDQIGP